MGVYFYPHSMVMQDRTNWYSYGEPGESITSESEELEDLDFCTIKFNKLMREPVSAQLRTILNKENKMFTEEMLSGPDGKTNTAAAGERNVDIRV